MSAIDAYRRMVKTAASDERPHTMLPGRTTVSKRGSTGTIAPKIKKKKVAAEEESPFLIGSVLSLIFSLSPRSGYFCRITLAVPIA